MEGGNMEIVTARTVKITHLHKSGSCIAATAKLYGEAVDFCVNAFETMWSELQAHGNGLDTHFMQNYLISLVHSAKGRVARFPEFDKRFYKMPQFMLQDVVTKAYGHLSSYHSKHDKWENGGRNGSEPTLGSAKGETPTFYRKGYKQTDDGKAMLKLYNGHDWVWVEVSVSGTDMRSLWKSLGNGKLSCPTLQKRHHGWVLVFAIKEHVQLPDAPEYGETVLAVDLGINTDASCSVIRSDGTVLAREFVNFASEKDHIMHMLNRIRRISREIGSSNTHKVWEYVRHCNKEHAIHIAKAIVDIATIYNVDCIVFEHLDTGGKKHGSKKQKLAMWNHQTVQNVTATLAHKAEIRISHICAWGTSKLAYDGSGAVLRGKNSTKTNGCYSICEFQSGKVYNCDLNASYNIGARYFIREIKAKLSQICLDKLYQAYPESQHQTQCTLDTLRKAYAFSIMPA